MYFKDLLIWLAKTMKLHCNSDDSGYLVVNWGGHCASHSSMWHTWLEPSQVMHYYHLMYNNYIHVLAHMHNIICTMPV